MTTLQALGHVAELLNRGLPMADIFWLVWIVAVTVVFTFAYLTEKENRK